MAPYRSMFEKHLAENLTNRKIPFEYETISLPYTIPAESKRYTPDFVVTTNGGRTILVEAKGLFSAEDRKKALWVRDCNPDADVRFVFQNPALKINPNAKQSCAQWAERNGFKWADKFIPEEWLQER